MNVQQVAHAVQLQLVVIRMDLLLVPVSREQPEMDLIAQVGNTSCL